MTTVIAAQTINEPEETAAKTLEEYEQSKPPQLALFSFNQEKEKQYSNSIYLYDAIRGRRSKRPENTGSNFAACYINAVIPQTNGIPEK